MAMAPALAESEIRRNGVSALADRVWWAGLSVLLAPALAAWIVRGVGLALRCAPEAKSCFGSPFDLLMGALLRGALDVAWIVSTTVPITVGLTLVAAFAAIVALRPVAAALTVLIAPLASLMLPIALVNYTSYDGCQVNADGLGECLVWGQPMGMSFHTAASAGQLLYTYTPLVVSGAVVIGLLGWIVQWGSKQMKKS